MNYFGTDTIIAWVCSGPSTGVSLFPGFFLYSGLLPKVKLSILM